MSKTKKIIIFFVILILIVGFGYTETKNIMTRVEKKHENLKQTIFSVKFTGTPTVSDNNKVNAKIESDQYATLNVKGLTSKGEKVYATYELQNVSPDLAASLAIETFNTNKEYFLVKSELDKNILEAGEITKVTVTVELIKTPIKESVSSVVGIGPVQSDS